MAREHSADGNRKRCGGGQHELVVAAQKAMEGSERPALQVRNTRWIQMGGRCTDDLGLVVVVGQG